MDSSEKKSEKVNQDFIVISTNKGQVFLKIEEIKFCKADGSYTKIYMMDGTFFQSSKVLAVFEKKLSNKNFFRAHRSHLVNLNYIKTYDPKENVVLLTTGERLAIAWRRKGELRKILYKSKL